MLTGATLIAWPEVDLSALQLTQPTGTSKNWILIGLFILMLALLCFWLLQERNSVLPIPNRRLADDK